MSMPRNWPGSQRAERVSRRGVAFLPGCAVAGPADKICRTVAQVFVWSAVMAIADRVSRRPGSGFSVGSY